MKPALSLKAILKFQVLKQLLVEMVSITSSVIKTWNDIEKITKDVLMNRDNKSIS